MPSWFQKRFPDQFKYPFPAAIKDGITYIHIKASELDDLRRAVREIPVPVPLVPIVSMDIPLENPPKYHWIRITRNDVRWYKGKEYIKPFATDFDNFTELIEEMMKV